MTLRKKIADHIARTISPGEAAEVNILLGLLIAYFADCTDGFMRATSEQLSVFLRSRYKAAATVARRLSTMRLIFAALFEWGLIESNPAMDVERPAVDDGAPDFGISGTVVEKLIASQRAFVESVNSLMVHTELMALAVIHLMAAGVFLAEVEKLAVRDLNADRIIAGRGTQRQRAVWLSTEAVAAINGAIPMARQLPPAPASPLFVTKRGVTLNTKLAWVFVKRAIVRAGLQDAGLTPAKIHRTAATVLIDQGFGWSAARNPSAYRRIPRTKIRPSFDEMERAIASRHPLEFA